MGIFDRIFKKAEKKEPRKSARMRLGDVEKWAKDASSEIQKDIVAEFQQAVDEILQHVEEAREVVEEIRDYKPPPEIKKRMFKPVKTAKPKYVKGMLDGLGNIRPMTGESYEALFDFNKKVAKALKIIQTAQINQGRIIAMFFQEEMPRLGTALNRIIDLQKSIEEGINEGEKKTKRISTINEKLSELSEAKEIEKQNKKEAKEAREEIGELKEKRTKHERDLEKIRESEEYKKLQDTEGELLELQEKIKAIESKGRNLLGPLVRVLRKYQREVKDKSTKKITESYIKDPQKSLFESANGAEKITRILKEVCAMADRGELAIDKKRREKVENATANLETVKQEHTKTRKEIDRLENELASSSVKQAESTARDRLKEIEGDIDRLKGEAEIAKAKAKAKRNEIKELKKELQEDLREEIELGVVIEI